MMGYQKLTTRKGTMDNIQALNIVVELADAAIKEYERQTSTLGPGRDRRDVP